MEVYTGVFHHVEAGGGVGAVGSDEEVEGYFDFSWPLVGLLLVFVLRGVLSMVGLLGVARLLEPGDFFVEVCTCELVVEMEVDV